jgi:hypothetical protein
MDKYDKSRCSKEEADSRFKQYIDIILDEKLKGL